MRSLSLATLGGACAILTVVGFVVGIPLIVTGGVQVLIPETGQDGIEWIADVDDASDTFYVGAWILIFAGFLGIAALVGFYDALRDAGPVMILAPIAGAVGLTLVTISHLIPIAMAYELVPAYTAADEAAKETLAATADTLAMTCLTMNYAGNALNWGVAVPLYAFAVLKTGAVPRWIGWVGLVAAVFAGWLGLLGPAWSVIEGVSMIGFVAFFVFMASMGVALLRRRPRASHT
ncbi:MAG: DUF4386 family protein [Gaiellaceae bacterium]